MTVRTELERVANECLRRARSQWLAARFRGFRRLRQQRFGTELTSLSCPGIPDLVSVVLPVFNGADLIVSAIESILAQDYPQWELIIIDDGSQDDTARIIDEYAARDARIRVVHQENRKIPKTLSRGFRMARGQYLTWTSADNRLRPSFLRLLVSSLERHPDWDLVYANQDIIDEDGEPLRGSSYFTDLQTPPGSEHLHLPSRTDLLHAGENFIGAAFMYRSRVAHLLGDYSNQRFTVEDYDYWLRCNTLLNVHHVDFLEPVYEYRFHGGSLTARAKELRIAESREQLLVFDGFRQEFCLTPLLWICENTETTAGSPLLRAIQEQIASLGHTRVERKTLASLSLPRYFLPSIYLQLGSCIGSLKPPPAALPPSALKVMLLVDSLVPESVHPDWDLVAAIGPGATPRLAAESYQGLLRTDDLNSLLRAIDCRCRMESLRELEQRSAAPSQPQLLSIIIDSEASESRLRAIVHSLLLQDLTGHDITHLEILFLRRDPRQQRAEQAMAACRKLGLGRLPILRIVDYPLTGALASWSLCAAIAEANGEVIISLNEPLGNPHCLAELFALFVQHPKLALIQKPLSSKLPAPRSRSFAMRRNPLLLAGGIQSGRRSLIPSSVAELLITSQLQRLGYQVAECESLFRAHTGATALRFLPTKLRAVREVIAQSVQLR